MATRDEIRGHLNKIREEERLWRSGMQHIEEILDAADQAELLISAAENTKKALQHEISILDTQLADKRQQQKMLLNEEFNNEKGALDRQLASVKQELNQYQQLTASAKTAAEAATSVKTLAEQALSKVQAEVEAAKEELLALQAQRDAILEQFGKK